ncbi:TetR/AcrR family transcriptional regulator [Sphingomonas mucosissima]|uniref:HTH-type transcriptional regulator BetI n=1 Tax=Sphingomonas mucosissima TaxID=370959 RepID=A0A245ZFX6_9SPHN|nr:TetR/AcrR family transcriptional regulator [Sphingomonas mucosissima]OWK28651.1 HTH-type transcriptional regulator BetI [Sphingomonas mucosissima]
MTAEPVAVPAQPRRRLSKADRHHQLLTTALQVIRTQGADSLTLGHLATSAGVSKPVVYDHFGTRSGLLIDLYRWIDSERIETFRQAMAATSKDREETIACLADAYIRCAADLTGEFHIVGAALAGSPEKADVYVELLDQCVAMFVSVLRPFSDMPEAALDRLCIGLVSAGEGLSAAIVRGKLAEADAIGTFAEIIRGSLGQPRRDALLGK